MPKIGGKKLSYPSVSVGKKKGGVGMMARMGMKRPSKKGGMKMPKMSY